MVLHSLGFIASIFYVHQEWCSNLFRILFLCTTFFPCALETLHRLWGILIWMWTHLSAIYAVLIQQIPPISLKNIASSIAQPLATIFELFYQNSFLPHIWKQSYVKPIFKSNDSSSVSNYRPISLTCTCCKVMESVIHDQLMSYLSQHKLISRAQHGFLTKKSTGTNLLSCLHDCQLSLKNKKLIDIVYLDF